MRPLEDSASANREVETASVAAMEAGRLPLGNPLTAFASRTNNPVRPKSPFKIVAGRLGIGESLKQLEGAYCAFDHV